ncbi:helix-turn-helix domain-containing protein [Kitasatospora sp. NPDC002040]|uniref:helix-turn-helix transcriptional regulator n=1 Tax=Kitasatospora sp. NPDC002040 TaxID=3154661 RepID=UPI003327CB1B
MSNPTLTMDQVAQLIDMMTRSRPNTTPPGGLLNGGWYSTEDVAALIDVDPSTLRRWRTSTPLQGPPFVRLSARVTVYSIPDVQAWLESRRVVPGEAA